MSAVLALLGVIADRLLADPRRGHPLAAFGRLAGALEQAVNQRRRSPGIDRGRGLLALGLLVLPPTAIALLLQATPIAALSDLLLLWFALGARSLDTHATRVAVALQSGRLGQARRRVGWLVSRETDGMNATAVARATTESVLENGNDAVFAPLFWFLIGGGPAALAFRLINTLDAMWGYRTPRLRYFGWAAARLDDLVGWLPARLTALSYALLGDTAPALRCWRRQAALLDSPNGGPVMVSGAGALGIRLGGPARYHGELRDKPWFGHGSPPAAGDIHRAMKLVRRVTWLWVGLALLVAAARAVPGA